MHKQKLVLRDVKPSTITSDEIELLLHFTQYETRTAVLRFCILAGTAPKAPLQGRNFRRRGFVNAQPKTPFRNHFQCGRNVVILTAVRTSQGCAGMEGWNRCDSAQDMPEISTCAISLSGYARVFRGGFHQINCLATALSRSCESCFNDTGSRWKNFAKHHPN